MQGNSSKKISLIEYLKERYPESSNTTLKSWVESGRVQIDETLAKHPNVEILEGQKVSVGPRAKFAREDLKILYEDEHLVVIDKPAGLLSVATDLDKEKNAHKILKRRFHNRSIYPIHRLDQDTSGILVFAYTKEARDHLKAQLEERTMHREYRATVHGFPGKGTWRCNLEEDLRMRVHVTKKGKEAVTHFETVTKRKKTSILKLQLETGRKHQIRVQAAHFGFPIIGDAKYGKEEDQKLPFHLRAVALSFIHPKTGRPMTFHEKAGSNGSPKGRRPKQGRPSPQRPVRRGPQRKGRV